MADATAGGGVAPVWSCALASGAWMPYDDDVQRVLERAYTEAKLSDTPIAIGSGRAVSASLLRTHTHTHLSTRPTQPTSPHCAVTATLPPCHSNRGCGRAAPRRHTRAVSAPSEM